MTEKQGWQEAKSKTDEPKDKEYQTVGENIAENVNEWVFGDFSKRDARNKYNSEFIKQETQLKQAEILKEIRACNTGKSHEKKL